MNFFPQRSHWNGLMPAKQTSEQSQESPHFNTLIVTKPSFFYACIDWSNYSPKKTITLAMKVSWKDIKNNFLLLIGYNKTALKGFRPIGTQANRELKLS